MELSRKTTRLLEIAFCIALTLGLILTVSPKPVAAGQHGVPGFDKDDFVKIAEAGFDDPQNNYAFSGTAFKGDFYVGTARNFLYRIVAVLQQVGLLPPDYEYTYVTSPEGEPWSQELATDMSGEIWRYHKGAWERVYQSVAVDVSYLGFPGAPTPAYAAKEPGFRSMVTFTDKWGEQAIYAASGASLIPGRLLLKSTNGTTWEEVVTAPAFFESDSRSIAVHNGKLYVGPAGADETAIIWATDDPATTGDGSNWQKVADFTSEGPGTNVAVVSMASLNGCLYAGTQNDEAGFQVWKSDACSPDHPQLDQWTKIIDSGAGDMASTRALTMKTFKGSVIVGTSMFPLSVNPPGLLPPKGFEVIRIAPDDTWELLVGDYIAQKPPEGILTFRFPKSGWAGGFGNILNVYCWSLQDFGGVLYLGSFDMSSFLYALLGEALPENIFAFAGADLWKTKDGLHWEPVTLNGFDDPNNYGFRTILSKYGIFLAGTANPFIDGGLQIWKAGANK